LSSFDTDKRYRSAVQPASARVRKQRLIILAVASALTVGGIGLAIIALPTFILLYGGMLPALVAFLVDNRPGRYLFRTVGVTNAAGILPYVADSIIYSTGSGMAVSPVASIEAWLTIYGLAAGGWLMHMGFPMLTQIVFEMILTVRMRRYQTAHDALAKEWDLEPPEP